MVHILPCSASQHHRLGVTYPCSSPTPVIAVASAAPAMAASPDVFLTIQSVGCRESLTGTTRWRAEVTVTNPTSASQTVTIDAFTVTGTFSNPVITPDTVTLGANTSQPIALWFDGGNQNSGLTREVRLNYTWGTPLEADPTTVTFNALCSSQYPNVRTENGSGTDRGAVELLEPEVTMGQEPEDTATEMAPQPVVDQAEQTATPTSDN